MAFPSTFADVYNEVIAKVGLNATADLAKTKDWVNQVYAEVAVETEALQDYAAITLTASSSVYTVATGILRVKQMYVTPSGQGASRPLQPISLEQLLEWSASNSGPVTGGVTHYAFVGQTLIQFYPVPAAADVVTIYYVKLPTALSAAGDVPMFQEPYATECLVNGASFKAAVFLKDPDAALFKQLYDDATSRYRGHLRRREGSMTRQFRLTRGQVVTPSDPSVDMGW
jgi:hypothetical protein